MKKTIIFSSLFLIIGILIGTKIYTATTIHPTFNEGEVYYFLQIATSTNKELIEENTQKINYKIIEESQGKYYAYVGITKNIENAKKIKKIYENQNYSIYIKEKQLTNDELSSNITQFDLLINSTNNKDEILTINKVVIASYEEIIKK